MTGKKSTIRKELAGKLYAVSKVHAEIEASSGCAFITDLGSSNGSKINGISMIKNRAYQLNNNNTVLIGRVVSGTYTTYNEIDNSFIPATPANKSRRIEPASPKVSSKLNSLKDGGVKRNIYDAETQKLDIGTEGNHENFSIHDADTQTVESVYDAATQLNSETHQDGITQKLFKEPEDYNKNELRNSPDRSLVSTGGKKSSSDEELFEEDGRNTSSHIVQDSSCSIEQSFNSEDSTVPATQPIDECVKEPPVSINKLQSTKENFSDIEKSLDNMFEEVNSVSIEEPTQLMTQNLERILESTQDVIVTPKRKDLRRILFLPRNSSSTPISPQSSNTVSNNSRGNLKKISETLSSGKELTFELCTSSTANEKLTSIELMHILESPRKELDAQENEGTSTLQESEVTDTLKVPQSKITNESTELKAKESTSKLPETEENALEKPAENTSEELEVKDSGQSQCTKDTNTEDIFEGLPAVKILGTVSNPPSPSVSSDVSSDDNHNDFSKAVKMQKSTIKCTEDTVENQPKILKSPSLISEIPSISTSVKTNSSNDANKSVKLVNLDEETMRKRKSSDIVNSKIQMKRKKVLLDSSSKDSFVLLSPLKVRNNSNRDVNDEVASNVSNELLETSISKSSKLKNGGKSSKRNKSNNTSALKETPPITKQLSEKISEKQNLPKNCRKLEIATALVNLAVKNQKKIKTSMDSRALSPESMEVSVIMTRNAVNEKSVPSTSRIDTYNEDKKLRQNKTVNSESPKNNFLENKPNLSEPTRPNRKSLRMVSQGSAKVEIHSTSIINITDTDLKGNLKSSTPRIRETSRKRNKPNDNDTLQNEDSDDLNESTSFRDNVSDLSIIHRSTRSVSSILNLSQNKIRHKVLFTGLKSSDYSKVLEKLGGLCTEDPLHSTVLVTDKVRRTYKFLYALSLAIPIVSVNWILESKKSKQFLNVEDFILEDPAAEATFRFSLRESLEKAKKQKLLNGYKVVLTPKVSPPPIPELKDLIRASGGTTLIRSPATWQDKVIVVSREEDLSNARRFVSKAPKNVPLVSVECILSGILQQDLNFAEYRLRLT
ncbi:mediator of DNA damage checkpoint protein 1 [Orussus abietinus]|uniref:mediator of DNA damage checkpoint protein 1 n=1 Tax=Orussus abietinus TaxID=222816 RepID=UPI0006255CCF|nr:mediator of DNA damage checkpoint protein 1 [Orussus abietinus]